LRPCVRRGRESGGGGDGVPVVGVGERPFRSVRRPGLNGRPRASARNGAIGKTASGSPAPPEPETAGDDPVGTMIVVAVGAGGADVARAVFGLIVVLGVMLVLYHILLRVFGDG